MRLLKLASFIFLFNVMTFGNGPVMIPLIQSKLVDQRHWLTTDQLLYAFTVARVTPGQANVYVASIGYMMCGWAGALLCMVAILVPSYSILPMLHGLKAVRGRPMVRGFTRGLTAGSVGLILTAALEIGRRTMTEPITWVPFVLTLLMVQVLRWNPILSLALAAGTGAAVKYFGPML